MVEQARAKLKAAELEAAIMRRIAEDPDCSGIGYVYVRPTGNEPPQETWTHMLIARRPNTPRTPLETKALHGLLNKMRQEFDLLPE